MSIFAYTVEYYNEIEGHSTIESGILSAGNYAEAAGYLDKYYQMTDIQQLCYVSDYNVMPLPLKYVSQIIEEANQ